jgi:hypothetical protein
MGQRKPAARVGDLVPKGKIGTGSRYTQRDFIASYHSENSPR